MAQARKQVGMNKLRLLDLFSGIGGFSLGLERSGYFETVAFCEIEPFCRKVLAKHWPQVPCYDDVKELTAARLAADGIAVDAICGGFPCQDISFAGNAAGLDGERSGLWREYRRLIGELRPRIVVVENVAALLSRGLDRVLGDLAALGYDAEWHCIPASTIGAPHRRDRIWIIANTVCIGSIKQGTTKAAACDEERNLAPPECGGGAIASEIVTGGKIVAYPHSVRTAQPQGSLKDERGRIGNGGEDVADSDSSQRERGWLSKRILAEHADACSASWWGVEPDVGRVADGVPDRSHRLKALGNAVVPQVVELIGRAIGETYDRP